jgi:hypothetical protein
MATPGNAQSDDDPIHLPTGKPIGIWLPHQDPRVRHTDSTTAPSEAADGLKPTVNVDAQAFWHETHIFDLQTGQASSPWNDPATQWFKHPRPQGQN